MADGLANTALLGRKHLKPAKMGGRGQGDDNEGWLAGNDSDTKMSAEDHRPVPDSNITTRAFGSSHPAGCNIVFCDGSVHFLPYDIDRILLMRMRHRAGGGQFQMP